MGSVPALLEQRWQTGVLVGDAAHAGLVRIREGYIDHRYQNPDMLATTPGPVEQRFPTIWKGNNVQPWQGQLVWTGDWISLPNTQSADFTRSFANGASTGGGATGSPLTVVIDNIAFNEQTGLAGVYHSIDRGWFSPTRGVRVNARPSLWAANEFANVFNGGYLVELWEGYGVDADVVPTLDEATQLWSAPAASRTWLGWIDSCDLESHPDHVTLTCRDATILLTDQRVMGQNKAREIQSPITFADRRRTLGETKEFGNIVVSSGTFRSDEQLGAVWLSAQRDDPAHTEWIEIHLPAGHYESFYTDFPFDGETMWVSLKAAGGNSRMDTDTPVADGWVDLGLGSVPADGEPYIFTHANTWAYPSRRWSLGGHVWDLGAGSILRISFTALARNPDNGSYQAGTNSLYAFRYGTNPQQTAGVKAKGWILVEDAADVVRMVLLWAGFHEMDVENFGWTLEAPMVFAQDSFFIDVIDQILAQGNYLFFIDAPTDHDMSIGVPVFRPQSATDPPREGMLQVQDRQLLEALTTTTDKSNLPYVMRYRGAVSATGHTLFADLVKRYMGTYWPPWSGHDYTNLQGRNFVGGYPQERLGGVRRQFSQTDSSLKSTAECLFACILAAIQYLLAAVTGTFQTPGLPGVGPNQQVSVTDQGTGTNSRLWVASVDSRHTFGPGGSWHMIVIGSILDTEDMNLIAEDYKYTYQRYVVQKGAT